MKRAFHKLWPYFGRYRRGMILGFGALILKDLFAAGQPLIIGLAIDNLQRSFDLRKLLWFAAALVALSVAKGFFQYWMRVILIGISRDIEYDLRNDLFRHLVEPVGGFLRPLPHGRYHGSRDKRSECSADDARPGCYVLVRNGLTLILAIGVMLWVGLAAGADRPRCPTPVVSFVVILFGRPFTSDSRRSRRCFRYQQPGAGESLPACA